MKFVRIFIAIFIALTISACGFQAVYNSSEGEKNYQEELAAIKIQKGKKHIDQELKNHLERLLNPYEVITEPKYLLIINLNTSTYSTIITSSGASGREKVTLNASYILKDIKSQEVISTNSASAKDDYNVEDTRFANYISNEEIEINLTKLIAQNIRNSLVNDIANSVDAEDQLRSAKVIKK